MSRVALIEYFTSPAGSRVFVALAGDDAPRAFDVVRPADGSPVTEGDLMNCARRLIVDFHGLPAPAYVADREAFDRALSLPPVTAPTKRRVPLSTWSLGNSRFDYRLQYWDELSAALLPTAVRERIAECDLLCFVPHGPLHALPLAALRWEEGTYLIQRFGVCHTPSASVLRYCHGRNRRRRYGSDYRPSTCFVAAVAAAGDRDPREFEDDAAYLRELFPTGAAAHEQAGYTALLGATLSPGRHPASKELISQKIGNHDVVHLACHGVFAAADARNNAWGIDPLDSGLLVSDGQSRPDLDTLIGLPIADRQRFLLSARNVFRLRLNADLVTLRACSSGRSQVRSGDEALGLIRAFLYAGTSSVLVGLWDVHRTSSQRLLESFYRLWLAADQPLPKWRALQLAQQALMKDKTNPLYGHPYHWAAFALVGDWL